MPNGYRSLGIAALAAALLIAFGLGAYWMGLPYPQERYQPYQKSKANEGGASASVYVAKPVVQRTPCDDPQSETESDLCAQWRAAKAAEKSADWTLYGVVASAIGISLLLWQIMLTREAVKDTGDATKAMKRQNDIAKQVHRPWVTILAVAKNFVAASPHYFDTEFTFHNVGDTAALSLNFVVDVIYESPETEGDFWDRFESAEIEAAQSKICVVPRDKYTYQTSVRVDEEDIKYWAEPNIINPVMIVTAFYKSEASQIDWHKAVRAYRWIRRGGGSFSIVHPCRIDGLDLELRPQGGHFAT